MFWGNDSTELVWDYLENPKLLESPVMKRLEKIQD